MSNLSLFVEKIKAEGYSAIREMVINQQEENLLLDFKEKRDANRATLSDDDKRNYSKALSAFSNSNGGIIIWGVKASKIGGNGPDVANEEKPIKNLRKFLTDLNSLTPHTLIPVNPGVENFIIEIDNDEGFLITYVPESPLPPHRAQNAEHSYYTRAGDSFIKMEHFMLEDMFGRRQKPKLEFYYRVQAGISFGDGRIECQIVVGIKNIGKYLATYPAIKIKTIGEVSLDPYGIDGNHNWVIPRRLQTNLTHQENGYYFAGGNNDVIHPNTFIEVAKFTPDQKYFIANTVVNNEVNYGFQYEIFAENTSSISGELNLTNVDIFNMLFKRDK
ncbi:hypothetical protein PghCCS26_50840 [Paenibacillus glycanilyticus]|uniref:Schlafen AlbA-2 domain-containing protein n=1 Tax=Paenibacillus glycanilyticus TaxID=126569 RepID=A0ABQ6NVF7_9BACL|nr:ATP-binding protein [Paenibacillus glycanilyticus]GMK47954.1 hypothetical protein PghCCS26_50840 [Paenibacillus glycanilyticus]